MATQVQNFKAIMDALADAAGKPERTNEQLTRLAENYTKTWDDPLTNEQKAQKANVGIYKHIRELVRRHAELREAGTYVDDVENAGDTAVGDL